MALLNSDFEKKHGDWLLALEAHKQKSNLVESKRREAESKQHLLLKKPARFLSKTFADYIVKSKPQEVVKRVTNHYVRTFEQRQAEGSNLILEGNEGTGKTMLALIMDQWLIARGYRVCYEPNLQFLKTLLEKSFESPAAFQMTINDYKSYHLLIIDEVGEGIAKNRFPTDWQREMLFSLINARYEHNLPTVVISNRNKEELKQRIGIPTLDRLNEKGITLAFTWESYRK